MNTKEMIIKLNTENLTVEEISAKLSCTKSYIYRVLRNSTIDSKKGTKRKECIELLKSTDMTYFMISRHLGISESTVRNICRTHNIRKTVTPNWF